MGIDADIGEIIEMSENNLCRLDADSWESDDSFYCIRDNVVKFFP